MDLKSLEDWVISKYIKSVPNVVDDRHSAASRASIRCESIPTSWLPTD